MAGNKPLITFGDVLKFGKHQDKKVEDVFEENPQWLEWALDTVRGFDFSQEDEDKIRDASAAAKKARWADKNNE